ncbi:MAG: sigma-70 family RNA polymerase sigma factor [Phycisphaerales bacterium]|nr:sigma-70 family RNA polymerase sigma factor [Phycisphaerales bacterium]
MRNSSDAPSRPRNARKGSSSGNGGRTGLSVAEEALLRQILSEPMDYIDSEAFYESDAEARIYHHAPEIEKPDVAWYRPLMDDLTPTSKQTSTRNTGTVLLSAAQERVLFLQYNYARHRVRQLQLEIGLDDPTEDQARDILRWNRIATEYREQIAETNLALVLAMAKRTRMSEVDFADLVSEGNMALLRSVDKFDCGRGFKFSTYACRAILKAFSRQGMKLSKYRQRFPTDFDPAMEKSDHLETMRATHERESAEEVKHIVLSNEADLTDVEQTVIHHRFGLKGKEQAPPLTLEQVGQIIGVTKERVRQIQNKALEKIRLALEESRKDALEQQQNGEDENYEPSPN